MGKIKNLIGMKFGRLTVIGYTEKRKWRQVVWKCQCECGNIVEKPSGELTSGQVLSCDCLMIEKCSETGKKYNEVGRNAKLKAKIQEGNT